MGILPVSTRLSCAALRQRKQPLVQGAPTPGTRQQCPRFPQVRANPQQRKTPACRGRRPRRPGRDGQDTHHLERIRKTPVKAYADSPECFRMGSPCCGTSRTPSPTGKYCGFAGGGSISLVLLPGAPGSAHPASARCGCAGHLMSSKAPSPVPSPSGGGCRPQGRPERENVTGPRR